ncbi:hypothetical protein SprV_0702315900 [Sparganum proliferum]
MASGVTCKDDCLDKFTELKLKKSCRYVLYKIVNEKEIVIDKVGDRGQRYLWLACTRLFFLRLGGCHCHQILVPPAKPSQRLPPPQLVSFTAGVTGLFVLVL